MHKEYIKTHSIKPEIIDPHPREMPQKPPPPRQPRFVRFMQKRGMLVVVIFTALMMLAYGYIENTRYRKFEVMQMNSVSSETLDTGAIQKSLENYAGFALLMELQYGGEKEYEDCFIAYKILGGYRNNDDTEILLYLALCYEAGHFAEGGGWEAEIARQYIPAQMQIFQKDERFSTGFVDVYDTGPHITGKELTAELLMEQMAMPESFARRIVDHPTAAAELQAMLDKMLGRVW